MEQKIDYKKAFKDMYLPKTSGMILDVPAIPYLMVKGHGDPNEEDGAYHQALQILYSLTFTIKMSKKGCYQPSGYHDYVLPPLEGLWWMDEDMEAKIDIRHKENFSWISMLRVPDYVTPEVFAWAKQEVHKKHPDIDFSHTTLEVFEEGLCAQILHKGSYDDEPATMDTLYTFLHEKGYALDIASKAKSGQYRLHHELYLSDPRRCKAENLKTVIRLPIVKVKDGTDTL